MILLNICDYLMVIGLREHDFLVININYALAKKIDELENQFYKFIQENKNNNIDDYLSM